MVRHIVFLQLNEEGKKEGAEAFAKELQYRLDNMGHVEGFLKAEVGVNHLDGQFDVMLYSEFTDKAAVEVYQVFEPHVDIKNWLGKKTSAKAVVDAEY